MAQAPSFTLLFTDGDSTHVPNAEEIAKDYKTTDDYSLSQRALEIFASEMARRHSFKAEKGKSERRAVSRYLPSRKNAYTVNLSDRAL